MNKGVRAGSWSSLLSLALACGLGVAAQVARGQCAVAICPTNTSIPGQATLMPPNVYSRSVAVQTGAGCPWTASSTVSWIRITSATNGTGPGTVQLSITNSLFSRHATITIANRPYTVWQGPADTICIYSNFAGGVIMPATGGVHSFEVFAPHGCAWTPATNKAWIAITAVIGYGVCGDFSTDGGDGEVFFAVTANTNALPRTGLITFADREYIVDQRGVGCTYTICPTNTSVPGPATGMPLAGIPRSVQVLTSSGCTWTATSTVSWIKIVSGAAGTGPGTVQLSITNSSPTARSGTITIAGKAYTVYQGAADTVCINTISPTNASFAAAGGGSTIAVTAPHGCSWTPFPSQAWITVTGVTGYGVCGDFSADGGTGVVFYTVAPNINYASRTGYVGVAGQTLRIIQSGSGPAPAAAFSRLEGLDNRFVVQWLGNRTNLIYLVEYATTLPAQAWMTVPPTSQWWQAGSVWTNPKSSRDFEMYRLRAAERP